MRRVTVLSALCLAFSYPAWAANSQDCPYGQDYLSQQLGQKLKVVTQMKGLLGSACEYADDNRTVKISVDAGPNPAPSADMWRKMANPPGTKWTSVANDPDKAVTMESSPNGAPFPSLSYERNGWLVQINVMGVTGMTAVNQWNTKLLNLKRLPQ